MSKADLIIFEKKFPKLIKSAKTSYYANFRH